MPRGQVLALLSAAVIVALAILVSGRYQIAINAQDDVVRLDRWTGSAVFCNRDQMETDKARQSGRPVPLICD